MTETNLERLLAAANGGSVTIPRKQAQELAQKLKAVARPARARRG